MCLFSTQNLESLKEVVKATGGDENDLKESKVAKRLTGIVGRMIEDMNLITSSQLTTLLCLTLVIHLTK